MANEAVRRRRQDLVGEIVGARAVHLYAQDARKLQLHGRQMMIAREEIGMFRLFPALAITMLLLLSGAAAEAAEDAKGGAISVKDAWSRATPEGAEVGVGYLTITND